MNLETFNYELRDLLKTLSSDGFTKKDISSLTFGSYRQDQLSEFLNGRDVSGKPLSRIFDDLGFDLHLVPINKKDIENREIVDRLALDSFDTLRLIFVDFLQQKYDAKKKKKLINVFIDKILNKINKME